ncbi:hypothetical protein M1L60_33170 [Actinoplanes sp. TRM 88003]|uniref:Uncharacterized protein n=1 Tax=Paractinoplanes aksuensis TaxID=2939490 RepID=A0ABT1DXE0_9ACTN|nr:hypothetical protein [Actinoplanes aksuensis]MCO8275445.1 hypothetical protein [Actinoplanes aksuensis]
MVDIHIEDPNYQWVYDAVLYTLGEQLPKADIARVRAMVGDLLTTSVMVNQQVDATASLSRRVPLHLQGGAGDAFADYAAGITKDLPAAGDIAAALAGAADGFALDTEAAQYVVLIVAFWTVLEIFKAMLTGFGAAAAPAIIAAGRRAIKETLDELRGTLTKRLHTLNDNIARSLFGITVTRAVPGAGGKAARKKFADMTMPEKTRYMSGKGAEEGAGEAAEEGLHESSAQVIQIFEGKRGDLDEMRVFASAAFGAATSAFISLYSKAGRTVIRVTTDKKISDYMVSGKHTNQFGQMTVRELYRAIMETLGEGTVVKLLGGGGFNPGATLSSSFLIGMGTGLPMLLVEVPEKPPAGKDTKSGGKLTTGTGTSTEPGTGARAGAEPGSEPGAGARTGAGAGEKVRAEPGADVGTGSPASAGAEGRSTTSGTSTTSHPGTTGNPEGNSSSQPTRTNHNANPATVFDGPDPAIPTSNTTGSGNTSSTPATAAIPATTTGADPATNGSPSANATPTYGAALATVGSPSARADVAGGTSVPGSAFNAGGIATTTGNTSATANAASATNSASAANSQSNEGPNSTAALPRPAEATVADDTSLTAGLPSPPNQPQGLAGLSTHTNSAAPGEPAAATVGSALPAPPASGTASSGPAVNNPPKQTANSETSLSTPGLPGLESTVIPTVVPTPTADTINTLIVTPDVATSEPGSAPQQVADQPTVPAHAAPFPPTGARLDMAMSSLPQWDRKTPDCVSRVAQVMSAAGVRPRAAVDDRPPTPADVADRIGGAFRPAELSVFDSLDLGHATPVWFDAPGDPQHLAFVQRLSDGSLELLETQAEPSLRRVPFVTGGDLPEPARPLARNLRVPIHDGRLRQFHVHDATPSSGNKRVIGTDLAAALVDPPRSRRVGMNPVAQNSRSSIDEVMPPEAVVDPLLNPPPPPEEPLELWKNENKLRLLSAALAGPRVLRATESRKALFSAVHNHRLGRRPLAPHEFVAASAETARYAKIVQLLGGSKVVEQRREMAQWAADQSQLTDLEQINLVIAAEIGLSTRLLAEHRAAIEDAADDAEAAARALLGAPQQVPLALPDPLGTADDESTSMAGTLAVYWDLAPSLVDYVEAVRDGNRAGRATLLPLPPIAAAEPHADLIGSVLKAAFESDISVSPAAPARMREAARNASDESALLRDLVNISGLNIQTLEMPNRIMSEQEAQEAVRSHADGHTGPAVLVVRMDGYWRPAVLDPPHPETRPVAPWYTVGEALGEFAVARVVPPDRNATVTAVRTAIDQYLFEAGVAEEARRTISDAVGAAVRNLLTDSGDAAASGEDQLHQFWEKIILEGVTVAAGGRIAWIKPQLTDLTVLDEQPAGSGRYGVSFASTSVESAHERDSGVSLLDMAAEFIFTSVSAHLSRVLWAVPQISTSVSGGSGSASSMKVISSRKVFAINLTQFTGAITFTVSLDGEVAARVPAPRRGDGSGTVEVRFPTEYVLSPRSPRDLPHRPPGAEAPRRRDPFAGTRETLNAVDVGDLVRATHHRLAQQAGLSPTARVAIATRLVAEVLNERALRNRSIAALSNGVVLSRMTVGVRTLQPRVKLEPVKMQYLAGRTTNQVVIREDKGLVRGTKQTEQRSRQIAASSDVLLRGITLSPESAVSGSFGLTLPEIAWEHETSRSLDVKAGNHTVLNVEDHQHRYRTVLRARVDFLGEETSPVVADVSAELGVLSRDWTAFVRRYLGQSEASLDSVLTGEALSLTTLPVEPDIELMEAPAGTDFEEPNVLAPHLSRVPSPREDVDNVPLVLAAGRGHGEAVLTRWAGIDRVVSGVRQSLRAVAGGQGTHAEWADVEATLIAAFGQATLEADPDRVWAGAQHQFHIGKRVYHVVVTAHPGPLEEVPPDAATSNTRDLRSLTVSSAKSHSYEGKLALRGQARFGKQSVRGPLGGGYSGTAETTGAMSTGQTRKDYIRSEFRVDTSFRIPTLIVIEVKGPDGATSRQKLKGEITEYVSVPRFHVGYTARPNRVGVHRAGPRAGEIVRFDLHGSSGVRPFFGNMPELSALVAERFEAGLGRRLDPMTWPAAIRRLGEGSQLAAAFSDLVDGRGWRVVLGQFDRHTATAIIRLQVYDVEASESTEAGEIEKYSQQTSQAGRSFTTTFASEWSANASIQGALGQVRPDEDDGEGWRLAGGGGWSHKHTRATKAEHTLGTINITRETVTGRHYRAAGRFQVAVVWDDGPRGRHNATEEVVAGEGLITFLAEPRLASRLGLLAASHQETADQQAADPRTIERDLVERDVTRALTYVEHMDAEQVLGEILAVAQQWGLLPAGPDGAAIHHPLAVQLEEMFRSRRLEDTFFDLSGSGVVGVFSIPGVIPYRLSVETRVMDRTVVESRLVEEKVDGVFRSERIEEYAHEDHGSVGDVYSGQLRIRKAGDGDAGGFTPAGSYNTGTVSAHGTSSSVKDINRLTTKSGRMTEFTETMIIRVRISLDVGPWNRRNAVRQVPGRLRYIVPTALTKPASEEDAPQILPPSDRVHGSFNDVLRRSEFQVLTFRSAQVIDRLVGPNGSDPETTLAVSESLLRTQVVSLLSGDGLQIGDSRVRLIVNDVRPVLDPEGRPVGDKFKARKYTQSADAPTQSAGKHRGWNAKGTFDLHSGRPTPIVSTGAVAKFGGSGGLGHNRGGGTEGGSELSTTIERNAESTKTLWFVVADVTVQKLSAGGDIVAAEESPSGLTLVHEKGADELIAELEAAVPPVPDAPDPDAPSPDTPSPDTPSPDASARSFSMFPFMNASTTWFSASSRQFSNRTGRSVEEFELSVLDDNPAAPVQPAQADSASEHDSPLPPPAPSSGAAPPPEQPGPTAEGTEASAASVPASLPAPESEALPVAGQEAFRPGYGAEGHVRITPSRITVPLRAEVASPPVQPDPQSAPEHPAAPVQADDAVLTRSRPGTARRSDGDGTGLSGVAHEGVHDLPPMFATDGVDVEAGIDDLELEYDRLPVGAPEEVEPVVVTSQPEA